MPFTSASGRQRQVGRSLWVGSQPDLHTEFQANRGYLVRHPVSRKKKGGVSKVIYMSRQEKVPVQSLSKNGPGRHQDGGFLHCQTNVSKADLDLGLTVSCPNITDRTSPDGHKREPQSGFFLVLFTDLNAD